jgi:DNA polymerase III epsilon subunit family exonuclease
VQGVLLLFVPPTVVAGGILGLLYFLGVHHHPAASLVTLLVGGAVMVAYLGFMVHGMGESLVAALREMQFDTEVMATVNPAQRLRIETGDELESLATSINRLGDRLSAARNSLTADVARATEEIAAERTFLAGILEAAGTAIVALARDGRVGLANAAARALLAPDGFSIVGRKLSDLVGHEDAGHIEDRMQEEGAPIRVLLRKSDGSALEAVATKIASGMGERGSVVLVLREGGDPSRHAAPVASETAEALQLRGPGPSVRCVSAGPRSTARIGDVSRLSLSEAVLFEARVGQGDHVDRERPIAELDATVFDSETTGLDRDARDRVVSLAGVQVRGGVVRRDDIFDALVNPGRPIPSASIALHGVTDAMVADAPPIEAILPAFLRFSRGCVLVGHHAWFDFRFLDRECVRLGFPSLAHGHAVLDTHLLARLVNGSLADLGLEGIAHRLGVSMEGRHSALGDALATAEIYVRLLTLLRERGIVTLGQARDAVARLPHVDAY